jgi:putative AlgH/UPF0301 family transcriptional regulator
MVALAALGAAALPAAASPDPSDLTAPVVLVAKPSVKEFYAGTVLFVRPIGGGAHLGFMINRPTDVTLARLFPQHEPSRKVTQRVLLGGPEFTNVVFAVVQKRSSPGGNSLPFAPDLFLAFDLDVVNRIIEQDGDHARFLVGMILWRPGELAHEIRNGFWFVRDPDAKLLFAKSTDGLWEELVAKSRSYV